MKEHIQIIVCVHACVCIWRARLMGMCFTNCLILDCNDNICLLPLWNCISQINASIGFKSSNIFNVHIIMPCASVYIQGRAWNCIFHTYIEYVIFKAERALFILRLMQHCTSTHENCEHQNTGANVIHHQRVLRPFISFILHLTWEGTLMWNCLMIYCDWCLNACMSILCWSPMLFFFLLSSLSFSVCLQGGHFKGRRPSFEHRRNAFKQREARWRFDHADAEQPGSSVPDWVWRLCHGWAHTHREYVEAW